MDIYSHELASFEREIKNISQEKDKGLPEGENLTHFSLGISNRSNLIIIGMCALVEAFLYEIGAEEEKTNTLKMKDVEGIGLTRSRNYIRETKKVDLGQISKGNKFLAIYVTRNALVHGYGGLIDSSQIQKVEEALKILRIPDVLYAKKRIRMNPESLLKLYSIVKDTIENLKVAIQNSP